MPEVITGMAHTHSEGGLPAGDEVLEIIDGYWWGSGAGDGMRQKARADALTDHREKIANAEKEGWVVFDPTDEKGVPDSYGASYRVVTRLRRPKVA